MQQAMLLRQRYRKSRKRKKAQNLLISKSWIKDNPDKYYFVSSTAGEI